jgi:hypothetical protein
LIEELEHTVFPRRNVFVKHAMAVFHRETDSRINFQNMWPVEAFQLTSRVPPGGGTEIILCVSQHDGGLCLAECAE